MMKRLLFLAPTVLVLAHSACSDVNRLAEPDDVMVLSAEPAAITADGFSTTTISVRISRASDERFRDVIFTTTNGEFVASTADDPRRIVVSADTSGEAKATLRAALQAGSATVTAEIRDGQAVKVARTIEVQFQAIPASALISIEAVRTLAPADGASVTDIVATIAQGVPLEEREVLFSTTLGSFSASLSSPQSRVQLTGSNNVARVGLVSPRVVGAALVSAQFNGRQSGVTVQFEPALPDGIAVSVFGSLQMKATFATKSTVEAELFRIEGKVTPGTEVIFRAFDDSTGNQFGSFSGSTPSDDQGRVRVDFTPGNTVERGEAIIRVRVPGNAIVGRVHIEIVDP